MKVSELRAALAAQGLDTAGLKAELEARLSAAAGADPAPPAAPPAAPPRSSLLATLLTLLLCFLLVLTGVWINLDSLVERVVNSDSPHPGVAKLKIGFQMAGGAEENGAAAMAGAIRQTVRAAVFGVQQTESRKAWHELLGLMATADTTYLSPKYRDYARLLYLNWPAV